MSYSNSKFVNYTKLSPFYSSRGGRKIEKITIHHMAGIGTVESCGSNFQTAEASTNYAVDGYGRVGMYVEEKNSSWASCSYENDSRAVTIEVANDVKGGNWHVSDKALEKTIDLCVDICERNGIKKLIYTGNSRGNLTRHNMFANTACPGPYLQSKFPYIVNEVNQRLEEKRMATIYKKGDSCIGVLAIKEMLIKLYSYGAIKTKVDKNGKIGTGTVEAVKECQKLAGRKQTGNIEAADVKAISKLVDKYQPKSIPASDDVNGDGKVSMQDVTDLQQHLAGLK